MIWLAFLYSGVMRQRRVGYSLAILVVCLSGAAAVAQDDYEYATAYDYLPAEEQPKEGRTVLFTLKYISAQQLRSALELTNADVEINPSLNLIAARSADEEELEIIRRMVETLDVAPEPRPNVELTAYILASAADGAPTGIPAELGEKVSALEARFDFGALKLLDSLFLRVGDGSGGRVEGSFPSPDDQLSGYQLQFDAATVTREGDTRVVRLDALTFAVTGENPAGVHRALLRTDVEVGAGEQAMVGKATPRGVDETLILLVAAEVEGPQ